MGDLTTLAKVKTYMGITGTGYDDKINLLIPAVSAAIETYCNREFLIADYSGYQWSEGGPILYLQNTPVVQVRRVVLDTIDAMDVRCTSSIATAATLEVSHEQDKIFLNVFGDGGGGEVPIGAKTLSQIKADIEALVPAVWEVSLRVDGNKKAAELLPIAGLDVLSAAAVLELLDEPIDDMQLTPETGRLERRCGNFPTQKNVYVDYRAGYADINALPPDLVQLATRIVADAVRASEIDTNLKSEKWPDYSYTTKDQQDINELLETYESELSFWRRIPL